MSSRIPNMVICPGINWSPQSDVPSYKLIDAIEEEDWTLLSSHLADLSGINISEPLVRVAPRGDALCSNTDRCKWQYRSRPILSTPLQVAAGARADRAVQLILGSKCVVTASDRTSALTDTLLAVSGRPELDVLRALLRHEVQVAGPDTFALFFQRTLSVPRGWELCKRTAVLFCDPRVSNTTRGHLLLSVIFTAKRAPPSDSDPSDVTESATDDIERTPLTLDILQALIYSGFDPTLYLEQDWASSFSASALRRLLHALPICVQTAGRRAAPSVLGGLLLALGRHGGLLGPDTRRAVDALPGLLQAAGYDLRLLQRAACLSPRLPIAIALREASSARSPPVLQQCCRLAIRQTFSGANIAMAVQELGEHLPRRLQHYLLLEDICPIPFDVTE